MRILFYISLTLAVLLPNPAEGCVWILAGLVKRDDSKKERLLPADLQKFGDRLDHEAINATVALDGNGRMNKRRTSANQRKIFTFMQQNPPRNEDERNHHISLYDQMVKIALFADADSDIIGAEAIKMIMSLAPDDVPPGTGDAFLLFLSKDRHRFKGQNLSPADWRQLLAYVQRSSFTGEQKVELRDAAITSAMVDLTLNPNLKGAEELYPANLKETFPTVTSFREADPAEPFYDWRETPPEGAAPTYSPLAVVRLVTEFGDLISHDEFRALVLNTSVRDSNEKLWSLQNMRARRAITRAIEDSPQGTDRRAFRRILKERTTWAR